MKNIDTKLDIKHIEMLQDSFSRDNTDADIARRARISTRHYQRILDERDGMTTFGTACAIAYALNVHPDDIIVKTWKTKSSTTKKNTTE